MSLKFTTIRVVTLGACLVGALMAGPRHAVAEENSSISAKDAPHPSLDLHAVAPFLTTAGRVGFAITVGDHADVTRVRIMIDHDGQENGWAAHGIDVMSEGATVYTYPKGETQWRWEQIGMLTFTSETNTLLVIFPEMEGGDFRWYAETFNTQWEVVRRFPETGVLTAQRDALPQAPEVMDPPAPDISELLRFMPATLSRNFQQEFQQRIWKKSDHVLPELVVPGYPSTAKLQFDYTDALTGKSRTLTPDTVSISGDLVRWSGAIDPVTTWAVHARPHNTSEVELIGVIESAEERCFRFSVGLQLPDDTWFWHDDMWYNVRMTGNREYAHDFASPYGLTQRRSYYPFGVVSSSNAVLVAETDGREPRLFIIDALAGAGIMRIQYDMATTPLTGHFPGKATFRATFRSAQRSAHDPFRETLQSWYDRDADWWTARSPRHGLWLPFTDINTIAGAEDFQFAFFEKVGPLGRDVDAAHQAGILNFPYTEPWLYWLALPDPSSWNYEAAMARMKDVAASGFGQSRDFASAGLVGASRQVNQRARITFLNTPWSNGARMEVNTDPELPVTKTAPVNRAMAEWRYIQSVLEDPRVDGIYLDSMSAMETIDYNTNALHVADYPATFVMADLKPGLAMPVQAVEFTSALGRYLKHHGKLLMGNFPCWKFPFFMPYIDVPGEETTWYSGNQFTPISGREMNYRRAISGAKPFGFLQATHFDTLSKSDMEKYFRECLFYAFMPSFFSHDGANDPYWVDAAMYERDRPLFRTYLPMTIRLSEAGWRPVPAVQRQDAAIRVEQFGRPDDALFYLTLRHTGVEDAGTSLTLDASCGTRVVHDLFSGRVAWSDGQPVDLFMTPGDVTVWTIARPEALIEAITFYQRWASNDTMYEVAGRNLSAFQKSLNLGVVAQLQQKVPVVNRQAAKLTVLVENRSKRAIEWMWDETSRPVSVAPARVITVDVPSDAITSEGDWLRVAWKIRADGDVVEFQQQFKPKRVDPFVVTAPPSRVQSSDTSATLHYQINAKSHEPAKVLFRSTIREKVEEQLVPVSSDNAGVVKLLVPHNDELVRHVRVEVISEGAPIHASEVYVVFAPTIEHLGMKSEVRLTADSAYSGYTTAALHDGILETSGLAWYEAAFATTESGEPHWIRYEFSEPVEISSVTAHWNHEGGITYASRCGEVWITSPEGEEKQVGSFDQPATNQFTKVSFEPARVRRVEWRQPSSCGSTARPGLLWLRELEVQ